MKTIAVICEKGGTGKSVLSNELYMSFVRQGVPVSLYSLDGQYSDSERSRKTENPEVAIVDTAGVLADNLKDIIEGADMIVVPVRPTPNDIEPFTRTVKIIKQTTKVPVLIVVNGFNRFRMSQSFLTWLKKKSWAENIVTIPQSEAIVQAEGMQKSVVEVDRKGPAAQSVIRMCRTAGSLVGIPVEVKKLGE